MAFEKAKVLVAEREKEYIKDDKSKHSNPQIPKPKAISDYLIRWWKQVVSLASAKSRG